VKHESFEDLVSLYFDDALDSEGIVELNRLLTQPEFAARFVHLSKVHGGMRELSAVSVGSTSAAPRRRFFQPWIPPAVAAAAFLVLIYVISGPKARLEESVGNVKFDGKSFESSSLGSATIVLPNGTRLMAGSETSLRLEGERIQLDRGRVAADITGPSSGKSLVISTPQAEARATDTRLSVSVDPEATFCTVEAGQVRLLQKVSNKLIDVNSGFFAVAAAQGEVKAERIEKPAVVTGAPAVRIVGPLWPKPYKVTTFRKESLIYGDRGWRITEIPPEVDGAQGIVTLEEDRYSTEERLLVFQLDRVADVWVGIDGRAAKDAKKLPTWLASWESTGLTIHSKTAGNSYFHLYRRRFPAGTVSLGGNHNGGDTGARVNYTVLITAPRP
jgi:hypothetical protein